MFATFIKTPKNLAFFRSFSTAPPTALKSFGNARVSLSGKVVKDANNMYSGVSSFLLRTNDPVYGSSYIRVHTTANIPIPADQYLHVYGHLHSTRFFTEHDKKRTDATVKATEVTLIGFGSSGQDMNVVELKGAVTQDVMERSKYRTFNVVTSFVPERRASGSTYFHNVRIYDDRVWDLVGHAIQKQSKIILTGRLEHDDYEIDKQNKKRNHTFIRATNIMLANHRSVSQMQSSSLDDERAENEKKLDETSILR